MVKKQVTGLLMSNSFFKTALVVLGLSSGLAVSVPAHAQWQVPTSDWDKVMMSGGFGFAYLRGDEYVYSGSSTLSHLIWQSLAVPVATATIEAPLSDGWRVAVRGEAGMSGLAYMEDYDWITPFATGNGPDDWSHRSQHPDTRTDHYFSVGLRGGRDFIRDDVARAGFHLEAHYTDVQWSAYGGSYVYSVGGLRDSVGTFTPGAAAITYRQRLPQLMAGFDMETVDGPWRSYGLVQGGLAISAEADDDHWMRDLRFIDVFSAAPVLAVEGRVDYAFSDSAGAFVKASARKIFALQGDTRVTNTVTNATGFSPGAAGADFMSVSVTAGLSGRF